MNKLEKKKIKKKIKIKGKTFLVKINKTVLKVKKNFKKIIILIINIWLKFNRYFRKKIKF